MKTGAPPRLIKLRLKRKKSENKSNQTLKIETRMRLNFEKMIAKIKLTKPEDFLT